jgi:outer membrane protein assembly factor BamD
MPAKSNGWVFFMKKLLVALSLTTLVMGFLSSCSTSTSPSEAYKDETPQQIFQRGKTALQDKSFSEASKRFEALDVQYPFGADTEQSQLFIIYAYYMKDDFALASSAADRFIRNHPTNAHVDYAYYIKGLSDYYQNMGVIERLFAVDLATRDLVQMQKSFADFRELVTLFPHSEYTPAARQYMVFLRNMIANHELEVAQYYYDHKAYVAAANRASDVVTHFEGAPAVKKALVLMAQSYQKLDMAKMEQDTQLVMQYNGVKS